MVAIIRYRYMPSIRDITRKNPIVQNGEFLRERFGPGIRLIYWYAYHIARFSQLKTNKRRIWNKDSRGAYFSWKCINVGLRLFLGSGNKRIRFLLLSCLGGWDLKFKNIIELQWIPWKLVVVRDEKHLLVITKSTIELWIACDDGWFGQE